MMLTTRGGVNLAVFTFAFDTGMPRRLRDAVNAKQELSMKKEAVSQETGKLYLAWDRICAIMDRLDDTIAHINSLELGAKENRSAFDFYEFISCAAVVIDCIRCIGNIFKVEPDLVQAIEDTQDVFGGDYSAKGTDKKFFEYIRSLCATHPVNTSHQKMYLNGAKFHCCPFVTWSHHWGGLSRDGDLSATVYTSKSNKEYGLHIPLYLGQFERYLQKWIDHIQNVIEAIHNYNESVYSQFRQEPVKTFEDFKSPVDYLSYIKAEYCRRFGDDNEYIFDEYIRVFSTTLTDSCNQRLLEKYRNAILYALVFLRNSMQNMKQVGAENTGIQYEDPLLETDLFLELSSFCNLHSAFAKVSYNLEKVYYLESHSQYSDYDKQYARDLLGEAKDIINQFVVFTNEESDEETLVLIALAQYLDALSEKTLLNKNIPNDEKYRAHVLTAKEWSKLFVEEPTTETISMDGFELEDLLKTYGQ